eukprot:6252422-Pyramimonas_sp.AAC.1
MVFYKRLQPPASPSPNVGSTSVEVSPRPSVEVSPPAANQVFCGLCGRLRKLFSLVGSKGADASGAGGALPIQTIRKAGA